jgi:chromosome segregation protein
VVISLLLRRLEAYGFKSFADKTELEFGSGITAIVGPNGSGKSNISDAIRWVLGEQSTRNLRSTKMEDVIFAGSSGRRPLGVAEVSIVFDNSDGTLSLDFNEVTITRRVFRSGDSEYFINKSPCRLKDIYELLADTGLGRDAMTVIGQNKVDEVLNSKPEERRLLFEESAGISKYKQRKKDAMRKLDDTTQNLIRVSDITNEIEVQLIPLAESAERTKRYNTLKEELTSCQVTLLLNTLEKSEKMIESANLQSAHLTESEITISTNLNIQEVEKERLTTQLAEVEEQLTSYTTFINQASTDLERIQGKISVLEERIVQGQRNQSRMRDEQTRMEKQIAEFDAKISGITENLADKKILNENLQQILLDKNCLYQNIVVAIQQAEQQLETSKEMTFDFLQEIVGERNKVTTIERDIARIQSRSYNFDQEYQNYSSQLSQTELEYNNLLKEQQLMQETLAQLSNEKKILQLEKQAAEDKLQEILQQEKQCISKLNESKSRLRILSNMQHEYEGFARGIKSVLKSNASWHSGICGAVAQILTVPDQYVTAIEIALGGALQHIITEDSEIAKQAMHFLKTQNLGRATFLPLNTIKPFKPKESEIAASKTKGSLGFGANLVTCEPRYQSVINFLLGRTIIAENIDIALQIAKQYAFSIKIVTLDGEVINPGGSMTGGSTNKRESSFLSRSNEIETIKLNVDNMEQLLLKVEEQLVAAKTAVMDSSKGLTSIQEKSQQIDVRQAEFAVHAERMQYDIKRLTLATVTINDEKTRCIQEEEQLVLALAQTRTNITNLEKRDNQHKEDITIYQKRCKELQDSKEILQTSLTDLKVDITTTQQEINAILANSEQYEQSKELIQNQYQNVLTESNATGEQIVQANEELVETSMKHMQLTEKKINCEQRHKSQYEVKLNVLTTLGQLEKDLKDLRRKHNEIQTRLHESELLATKYNYEISHSLEQLEQQLCLTVEQAKALCRTDDIATISNLVQVLEKELAVLGSVNHAAVEEYIRLQERCDFLKKQYQDLMSAKEYLTSIITEIDKTMSVKFIEAFTKINEFFGDIFARLFGGGQAQLKLADPDDVLSTGIEIIVQPPGKKLQNLVLLSGGERALTVIALLFAFLAYHPAPFIVVDEIDAPLDEANIDRLCEFLRDYAKHTQFIVVTHRKGTMEVANIIHGVTMEQSGISRLVSVKLMDKTG